MLVPATTKSNLLQIEYIHIAVGRPFPGKDRLLELDDLHIHFTQLHMAALLEMTDDDEALLRHVFDRTAQDRLEHVRKGRRMQARNR